MLPAVPTGMQSASSPPSRPSWISKAAVFWPSMRYSLTELTSTIGCASVSSRTSVSAWSKFPFSEITRAPCTSVWAILPCAILPSGTITAQVMPARAAYAAALAAVLPVEAQITAFAPSRTAAETAQVIPRSLNEPVGLAPSSFNRTFAPTSPESTGARSGAVEPSWRLTRGSPGSNGSRSRERSISGTCAPVGGMPSTTGTFKLAWFISLSKLLFDHANRPWGRAYELRGLEQGDGRAQARLGHLVGDHHQARVLGETALDDRLDRHALLAQHLRDGR